MDRVVYNLRQVCQVRWRLGVVFVTVTGESGQQQEVISSGKPSDILIVSNRR
jgi:hypothetical protein